MFAKTLPCAMQPETRKHQTHKYTDISGLQYMSSME